MAISAGAIWRVRIGGSNTLCSGLFDPTIAGAGTDYTEQDTAQLALTDLASATPYTTITSATGGFTAAMIGNGIYIASGTGFTAGRYIITAVTNTNTAVVDRACATAAASAGVAKLGGALANFSLISASASYGAAAGNVVMVRGQGSNDPIDIDYTYGTLFTNCGSPGLSYVGYNGRPKIGHNGNLFYFSGTTSMIVENFYFVQTVGTYLDSGVSSANVTTPHIFYNCVFDQGGFDSVQLKESSAIRCTFLNTGSQVNGTRFAYAQTTVTGRFTSIKDCLFKDLKGGAISLATAQVPVSGNVIQNCAGNGITFTTDSYIAGFGGVTNNTIYSVGGHGISLISAHTNFIQNNIIYGITGSGMYGIYGSAAETASGAYSSRLSGNNFYGNTTNSNITLNATNTTLDPQFANAPVDLTPTNTALRVIGGVGAL